MEASTGRVQLSQRKSAPHDPCVVPALTPQCRLASMGTVRVHYGVARVWRASRTSENSGSFRREQIPTCTRRVRPRFLLAMPSPSPPPPWPGAESDGRRQRSQMRGPDLPQLHQHRLCLEHLPHRAQSRLTSQLPGHQRHRRQQRHPHIPWRVRTRSMRNSRATANRNA